MIISVNIAEFLKTTFLHRTLKTTTLFLNKGKYIGPCTAWLYFKKKNFSEAEHLEVTNCS